MFVEASESNLALNLSTGDVAEVPQSATAAQPAADLPSVDAVPSVDVVQAVAAAPAGEATELTFRQLQLNESLIASLDAAGYSIPTPIQARTIPLLLAGRDVLGQAQTGTGKTAAFALPMLQRIDLKSKQTQVLVLTPTRELAIQVATAFERYAAGLKGLRVASIYGGQDYQVQFRQLDRGVHVIVGTPGRVMDHMRRGSLKLEGLQGLVLDEADEMLRMGFAEDVEWVLSQSPAGRQTALFSATMPSAIRRMAKKHMTNPAEVTIQQQSATADTVRQRFVIAAHQKQDVLGRILEAEPIDAVLVFVKTKVTSEPLAEFLSARGHRTAVLHGDIPQKQRERIVENLRAGKVDVLVATDVAARGLDVQRISHVINYDLPFDSEAYVHRIGRTGRAGRSGEAVLFVHPRERRTLKRLEQATRQTIELMEIPSNRTINKQRVARFHERIRTAMEHPHLEKYATILQHLQRETEAPFDRIAAALAVLSHGDMPLLLTEELRPAAFVDAPRPANDGPRSRSDRPSFDSKGPRPAARRPKGIEAYRVEVGRAHQVKPANIVGAIANESGLEGSMIGRIEIFDEYSIVDLPEGMPREIFRTLKKTWVAGRQLNISRVDGPPAGPGNYAERNAKPAERAQTMAAEKSPSDKLDKPKVKKPKRKKAPATA